MLKAGPLLPLHTYSPYPLRDQSDHIVAILEVAAPVAFAESGSRMYWNNRCPDCVFSVVENAFYFLGILRNLWAWGLDSVYISLAGMAKAL